MIYDTGVEHLEQMPLVRADGQTTQHMRAVSYWMGAPDLQDVTTVQICGTEWVAHATCIRQLMTELTPAQNGAVRRGVHPTRDIFHGMVAQQKRAVSSSEEGGLLIDDLLEWIDARLDSDPRMREVRRAHPCPERVAAQIALGYSLPAPVAPSIDFDPAKLLRVQEALAGSWSARERAPRRRGAGERQARGRSRLPLRGGPVRLYRRYLRLAVQRLDIRPLARSDLNHLAHWYLARERGENVERVVHTLLDRSARGLGLERGR